MKDDAGFSYVNNYNYLVFTAGATINGIGTEKVARTATIDETNPYLRQGNDDHWDSYGQNAYSRQEKYKWLDDTYKNFFDGAKVEIVETEKTIFDVIDPYDAVNFQLLEEEFGYDKPKSAGMPDFK